MWIRFDDEELDRMLYGLRLVQKEAAGCSVEKRMEELIERIHHQKQEDRRDAHYREQARELYANGSDDDIEVDDDATFSRGDDGIWVMMWGWLRYPEEEGENICRTCGEEYPEAGDGWDGECPDCADKTAAAEDEDES